MSELLDHLTNAQVHLTEAIRIQQALEAKPPAPDVPPPIVIPPTPSPGGAVTVKRITDAPASGWAVHEYASMSPFNADNSAILIIREGGRVDLHYGDGRFHRSLPSEVNASSFPQWLSPTLFTYVNVGTNRLRQFDIGKDWGSNAITTLHTFSQFQKIGGSEMGEADISEDRDHRVIFGDGKKICVYRISTDQVFTVSADQPPLDGLYMTPDNKVLISRTDSIIMLDRDMRFPRRIAEHGGHMDVTRDLDGSECLILPMGGKPKAGVTKLRLSDGKATPLGAVLDWSLAIHTSCPDRAGWALVSTYKTAKTEGAPDTPYTNKIIKVPLDGSAPTVLAEHHSRPFNDYHYTPRAAVSRDGTRFLFDSNEGIRQPNNEHFSNVFLGVIP
jgi:hypothetical protein